MGMLDNAGQASVQNRQLAAKSAILSASSNWKASPSIKQVNGFFVFALDKQRWLFLKLFTPTCTQNIQAGFILGFIGVGISSWWDDCNSHSLFDNVDEFVAIILVI